MREKKLNARLQAMAGFIGKGESIADIGADHGYLPLYLIKEGVSPYAILTDVRPGPLEKTRKSIEKAVRGAGAGTQIELRLGDGLSALDEAEVDTVVIAGMGGETIISILAADPDKALSFKKYILQPRTKTDLLKAWLTGAGWEVIAEAEAEERGRKCDVVACAPVKEKQ